GALALEIAGAGVVGADRLEDFLADLLFGFLVQDRNHQLDAPVKVARHPVGAGDVDLLLVADAEREGSAVLEEAAHDARDSDVLGDAGDSRPQAADSAN